MTPKQKNARKELDRFGTSKKNRKKKNNRSNHNQVSRARHQEILQEIANGTRK